MKITATDIKQRFTINRLQSGHIIASESEYFRKPDLLTISNNLRVCEYEIKVSISDLRRELEYIETVIQDQKDGVVYDLGGMTLFNSNYDHTSRKIRTGDNKYKKHRAYQFYKLRSGTALIGPVPNRFYFLIPDELFQKEQERLFKIPYYGVISADNFAILKKCQSIHNDEASPYMIWQAARNIQYRYLSGGENEAINN